MTIDQALEAIGKLPRRRPDQFAAWPLDAAARAEREEIADELVRVEADDPRVNLGIDRLIAALNR